MIRLLKDQAFVPGKNYIEAAGLSTDQKPTTGIVTGSRFLEVNTGAIYEFDEVSVTWSKVEDFDGDITAAVDAWLDAHPEATTTVEDGAISRAKLNDDLKAKTDAVSDLKSALDAEVDSTRDQIGIVNGRYDNNLIHFLQGSFSPATGTFTPGVSTRATTDFIYIPEGTVFSASVKTGYTKGAYAFYDSSKTLIGSYTENPANARYARFVVFKSDSSANITPDEAMNNTTVTIIRSTSIDSLKYEVDNGIINPMRINGFNSNQNLLPLCNVMDGKFVYTSGTDLIIGTNESYKTYIVPVEQTQYYCTQVKWWALVDDSGTVLYGCGIDGTYISNIDVSSYPTAKLFYYSTNATTAVYLSKTNGGNRFEWTLDGLAIESNENENVFCIPDFTFITGTEFKFYTKNASLDPNVLSKLNNFSGDTHYDSGYGLTASSATTRNYSLSCFGELLDSKGDTSFSVKFSTKNARNLTALFIGDSTINAGKITQKVLDIFAENNVTCTLLGLRGSGTNRHEGISGCTASGMWGQADWYGTTNNLYDSTLEHFDIGSYLTRNSFATPDFVFIQFGINDMFSASPFDITTQYNAYKTAMLNMINNIHTYNSNIKIVINMIIMPNESENQYGTSYGDLHYSWMRRATDIQANARLIEDMPDYVIMNPHHLVLDSATQIRDDVHPTDAGYAVLGTLDANVMFVN